MIADGRKSSVAPDERARRDRQARILAGGAEPVRTAHVSLRSERGQKPVEVRAVRAEHERRGVTRIPWPARTGARPDARARDAPRPTTAASALGEDPLDHLGGVLRRVDRVLDDGVQVAQLDDLEWVVALAEQP